MGHLGYFVAFEPGRVLDRLLKRWLCGVNHFFSLSVSPSHISLYAFTYEAVPSGSMEK